MPLTRLASTARAGPAAARPGCRRGFLACLDEPDACAVPGPCAFLPPHRRGARLARVVYVGHAVVDHNHDLWGPAGDHTPLTARIAERDSEQSLLSGSC